MEQGRLLAGMVRLTVQKVGTEQQITGAQDVCRRGMKQLFDFEGHFPATDAAVQRGHHAQARQPPAVIQQDVFQNVVRHEDEVPAKFMARQVAKDRLGIAFLALFKAYGPELAHGQNLPAFVVHHGVCHQRHQDLARLVVVTLGEIAERFLVTRFRAQRGTARVLDLGLVFRQRLRKTFLGVEVICFLQIARSFPRALGPGADAQYAQRGRHVKREDARPFARQR